MTNSMQNLICHYGLENKEITHEDCEKMAKDILATGGNDGDQLYIILWQFLNNYLESLKTSEKLHVLETKQRAESSWNTANTPLIQAHDHCEYCNDTTSAHKIFHVLSDGFKRNHPSKVLKMPKNHAVLCRNCSEVLRHVWGNCQCPKTWLQEKSEVAKNND